MIGIVCIMYVSYFFFGRLRTNSHTTSSNDIHLSHIHFAKKRDTRTQTHREIDRVQKKRKLLPNPSQSEIGECLCERVCVYMKNSTQSVCHFIYWLSARTLGDLTVWHVFSGTIPPAYNTVCNCGWVRCFVSGVPMSGICKRFMYCRQ